MALFDDASLVVTPNGYKEGTLYSIKPTSGLGDMTVVRATTATRVNSAGLVELVPYNLVEYSQNFGNAAWSKYDVTANTSAIIAPNGNADSYVIAETNTTAVFAFDSSLTTFSANTAYTLSIYAKWDASCTRNVHLRIGNCASSNIGASFDKNGNFVNYTGGSNGTLDSYTSTDVGNGWWRFTVTVTTANVSSVGDCLAIYYLSGTTLNYAGSTTQKINWFGGQLVEGTLPKDYQKTETRLNIPRLDYSNGTCPSLLVEPQRTNLLTYSEQFDNAAWGAPANVIANTVVSPDGTTTGDTLTGGLYRLQVFSATTYVFSFYAKKNAQSTFSMRVDAPTNQTFNFNLDTGIADGGCSMVNVGNGWYRCLMPFTSSLAGTGVFYPNVNGNNFYIWGAQLEQATYPTSYIPTTSAAVTRNADVISKTGISSLIGTEFTLFFDGYETTGGNSSRYLVLKGTGGTYANAVFLESNASNQIALTVLDNSSATVFGALSSSLTNGQRFKLAVRCKNNDFAYYLNGVQIATQASGTVPTTADIYLGYYTDYADNYNKINSAVIFPIGLTNAELISLTTI